VESARDAAEDALVAALSFYVDDDEDLPKPSAARGRPLAVVPPLAAAKLALHAAMRDARVSTAELARRLRIDEKAVRRLRDPLHRSHIGQVDAAMRALGLRLEVAASKAA
jgi:antitoxin HicB